MSNETKQMTGLEAYNAGFQYGVSFCRKYGIPEDATGLASAENLEYQLCFYFGESNQRFELPISNKKVLEWMDMCLKINPDSKGVFNQNETRIWVIASLPNEVSLKNEQDFLNSQK